MEKAETILTRSTPEKECRSLRLIDYVEIALRCARTHPTLTYTYIYTYICTQFTLRQKNTQSSFILRWITPRLTARCPLVPALSSEPSIPIAPHTYSFHHKPLRADVYSSEFFLRVQASSKSSSSVPAFTGEKSLGLLGRANHVHEAMRAGSSIAQIPSHRKMRI